MFRKLKIQNYILIDEVELLFSDKFNVITGETGAGKSVLLGALALISGHRAEPSVLRDKSQKCIIEAEICISNKKVISFLKENDIDLELDTIIRREINPKGKSRAFINDTPVVLKVLEQFSNLVFDLHTQDQNRLIKDSEFRLNLVDNIANSKPELLQYQNNLIAYQKLDSEIKKIVQEANKIQKELDYIQFQFSQLDDANLEIKEQEELEEEQGKLTHAEEIKQSLVSAHSYLSDDEQSIISSLITVEQELSKLSSFYPKVDKYIKRIQSNLIDLQDLAPDLESDAENIEYNPLRIEEINDRLSLLMSLQQKHQVNSVAELIDIRIDLDNKLLNFGHSNHQIDEKQKQLIQLKLNLEKASNLLTKKRKSAFKRIEQETIKTIGELGIPKARFELKHQTIEPFDIEGQDDIQFFFSANKGSELNELNKIASGGEISRLMLAIKHLLSESSGLSTLILDEIDTGISGEVANKMAVLMQKMAEHRQLIVITHLPQIAAKGSLHFKVKKEETENNTITKVDVLQEEERLIEIAKLLSGEQPTAAAMQNAKELIL